MADTLSPSEFEFLLASPIVPEGGDVATAPVVVRSASQTGIGAPGLPHEAVRTLRSIHERHASSISMGLGKLLRTSVEVVLVSLEEIPKSELQALLENPSCCFLAEAAPLTEPLLLEIGPSIGLVLVDRLLGGAESQQSVAPCRPLTAIEWKLLSRVATVITDALCEAWRELSLQQPRIVRTESNSRLATNALSDERVLVSTFEIALGETRGASRLVFSHRSLATLLSQLVASQGAGGATNAAAGTNSIQPAPVSASSGVPIVVQLAGARLTESELRGLAVGDIIVTDNVPADPVQVLVEGLPRFTGHAGQFNGRKAVRVGDALVAEVSSDDPSARDVAASQGGAE